MATKKETFNLAKIYFGELKEDIENENGSFDEIARKCFNCLLDCKSLLWNNDVTLPMIQLEKSIVMDNNFYLDNVFYMPNKDICFCLSNLKDGSLIVIKHFCEISREYILKFIQGVISGNYTK